MVKPRLIHKIRIEILKFPHGEEEVDKVWRTTVRRFDEIFDDPDTPRVIIKGQLRFTDFEGLLMTLTGSDESTDGYVFITEKTQNKHIFKPNDHITKIFPKRGDPMCVKLRITKVRPAAQRATFGLYRIDFKEDKRGEPS